MIPNGHLICQIWYHHGHFYGLNDVIETYEITNIVEKYCEMRDLILEKIATFQPQKSGWQFDQSPIPS